jgi:flagellar biosynthesis/type III secretory pathway chaperone
VLRAARHLNERNARMLAQRLSMNRARTEALLSAAGAATYAADGSVSGLRTAATRASA